MNDVSKLPKWAQTEINRLIRDVEFWKSRCRENITDANVFIEVGIEEDMPLPKNASIRFVFGTRYDEHISVRHDRHDPMTLYVAAGYGLKIQPWAANVVKIICDKT